MKISICFIIRQSEDYIIYLNNLFTRIENYYNNKITFEYFIYENNSTDKTKEYIKNFALNRNCKYLLEDIPNNTMKSGLSKERGIHMAFFRNKLKQFHGILDSNYVLLLDSDIVFKPNTIERLVYTLIDNNIAMASTFVSLHNTTHYYDSFAVITKHNISYIDNSNSCLFRECSICINKNIHKIHHSNFMNKNKIIPVKSAFGSLSLIKTNIYNKVKWSNSICEHHSFCEEVSKYGEIVINSGIKTIMTNHKKYLNYENKLYKECD